MKQAGDLTCGGSYFGGRPSLALVVLGVPLLAIGIGFLTTRSQLPLVRRVGL